MELERLVSQCWTQLTSKFPVRWTNTLSYCLDHFQTNFQLLIAKSIKKVTLSLSQVLFFFGRNYLQSFIVIFFPHWTLGYLSCQRKNNLAGIFKNNNIFGENSLHSKIQLFSSKIMVFHSIFMWPFLLLNTTL